MKQTDSHPTWLKLDNAAKIYPAAMRRTWTALFRFSAELSEPVEPEILQKALDSTMKRFPCFAVRLRRGPSGSIWTGRRSGPRCSPMWPTPVCPCI